MKKLFQLTALLIALLLLCGSALPSALPEAESIALAIAERTGDKPGEALKNQEKLPAGSSVCDWLAMALALGGVRESYGTYLSALEKHVTDAYAGDGCLSRSKATEYHRIALTVLALGGDPTHFGKKPDGTPVDLVADGTWNFDDPGRQGQNGRVYALLLLDAGDYTVPAGGTCTRESLLTDILAVQEPNGGFGLVPGASDVDITAMTLQALAPYREQYPAEIDRALEYLASRLTENCGFFSYGAENAESAAQTVIALCALGIDPAVDERFIRGGRTLLDELDSFRLPDGYSHEPGGEMNIMATEQVLLARIACEKRANGVRLYDFSPLSVSAELPESHPTGLYIALGAALCLAAAAVLRIRRRKKHAKHD